MGNSSLQRHQLTWLTVHKWDDFVKIYIKICVFEKLVVLLHPLSKLMLALKIGYAGFHACEENSPSKLEGDGDGGRVYAA